MIDKIEEPLQEWANANKPSQGLLYKEGYWRQIRFIRDVVPGIFAKSYGERQEIQTGIRVISTHRSKSVTLPVYKVELPDGIVLILRDNFYNWKASVKATEAIEMDCMGLFSPHKQVDAVYCEGFPESLVYGPYGTNRQRFTFEIDTDHHLFTFLWLLAHRKRAS